MICNTMHSVVIGARVPNWISNGTESDNALRVDLQVSSATKGGGSYSRPVLFD